MRIAFIGAQSVGKSTLIEGFLDLWPMYKRPQKTYRDIIEEKKLKLNKKGNEKSQRIILDALIDEIQQTAAGGDKYNIFDRCVADNIAYSLWLNENKKVSDNFIIESKTIVAETLKLYDIVFYLPVHKDIKVEEKKNRETDLQYREEIDNIFQALVTSYEKCTGRFFPLSDCPAVITLDKHPLARLDQIKLYINVHGNMYGEDTPSLITPFYS